MGGRRIKNTQKKEKKNNKKIKKILLRIFLVLIILGVIGVGVAFGVLYSLANGAWKLSTDSLEIEYRNSVIVDQEGNEIGTLSGDESRIIISKNEMSEYLPKAFISIEDERFETHNGVDLKRTLGATVKFITNSGTSSYGGSTITQQCIKNLTGEDEDSGIAGALRKVKEMVRAQQLEQIWSKDQIIELYLNLIPLGGDAYGVEVASIKYFNKSAKDLTLVESAYLAGITHAPSTYNPFGSKPYGQDETKTERINKRVTDVCYKMHELERITDEEYQNALSEIESGIKFEQGNVTNNINFSYHTEAAIEQVIKDLMKENGWTEKEAQTHLYGGGYTIYTTQDTELQKAVEEAYTNEKWIKTKTVTQTNDNGEKVKVTHQLQSGMVIMDHSTGYVIAGAGALGEKTAGGTNRMIESSHQPGSSIKPIAVIAPSMQEGLINAATVIEDTPVSFGGYTPGNDTRNYYGLMNIRYILRVSRNVPEIKMMRKLTVEKSTEYLKQMGLTTITDDEGLGLALGGSRLGISPLEMAGAYSTIANGGVYIEPTFYTKVAKSNGETLIEKQQETHRVLSEQNAWIVQSLMTEPTGTGLSREGSPTGSGAVIKGFQTCGKTGTTDNQVSTWFCGFTPYYTGTMYFAYDSQTVGKQASNTPGSGEVARRWKSIMTIAHEGLTGKKFEKPDGITTARVCTKSGLRATELCSEAGCSYTDYFVSGTVPKGYCKTHVEAMICEESGLLAGEHCTNPVRKIMITRENRDSSTGWEKAKDAELMIPVETCTVHIAPELPTEPEQPGDGEGKIENPTVPDNPEQQPGDGGGETENPVTPPDNSEQPGEENQVTMPEGEDNRKPEFSGTTRN